jgi:hypothetical protein
LEGWGGDGSSIQLTQTVFHTFIDGISILIRNRPGGILTDGGKKSQEELESSLFPLSDLWIDGIKCQSRHWEEPSWETPLSNPIKVLEVFENSGTMKL